ncbi:MAG: prolipoprotein diacylglyceryl transferase [Candidatus Margulisbacteria bacterium]|nr:prolipoprotein diacylglyceryl transferase [Candidatus Margulisiibacteriota bacterium]
MYPILLNIGPVTIYSYGLMIALAFAAGILIAIKAAKREGVSTEAVLDITLAVIISAIVGARIFYIIEFWRDFSVDPLSMFMVWHGGLVFYGGLLFAIVAVIIASRIKNILLWKTLDIAAPAAALGYAIGRIGCFLNGCCYGVICDLPWAVKFPELLGRRHPTQIYASICGLLIFAVLMYLGKRKMFNGQVFLAGVFLYSIYRFNIEFIRVNMKYAGLSGSQWVSILMFVFSIVTYIILYKNSKKI